MAGMNSPEDRSYEMGLHTEQLAGRTQQVFFRPEEEERFLYPWAPDVDYNRRTEDRRRLDELDGGQREAARPHGRGIRLHRDQEPARQALARGSGSSIG